MLTLITKYQIPSVKTRTLPRAGGRARVIFCNSICGTLRQNVHKRIIKCNPGCEAGLSGREVTFPVTLEEMSPKRGGGGV